MRVSTWTKYENNRTPLVAFSMNEARDRFMDRLHTLEPDCFASLCSLKGLALANTVQDNLIPIVTSGQAKSHAGEAEQAKQEYISQWQRRWHLVAVPELLSKGDRSVPDWRRMSQRKRVEKVAHQTIPGSLTLQMPPCVTPLLIRDPENPNLHRSSP